MTSGKCWYCGVVANMAVLEGTGTQHPTPTSEDEFTTEVMAAFTCDACGSPNIGILVNSGFMNPAVDLAKLLDRHPPEELSWLPFDRHGEVFADVPNEIAAAASEAHRCLDARAHRGAVLLARAVIEATAKSKGITSGSLAQKIDRMHEAQLVREYVRDGAHEVRYFGNEMAHGDFVQNVSREEAGLALTLMDEVLVEVFQGPARVQRSREARLARRGGPDSADAQPSSD